MTSALPISRLSRLHWLSWATQSPDSSMRRSSVEVGQIGPNHVSLCITFRFEKKAGLPGITTWRAPAGCGKSAFTKATADKFLSAPERNLVPPVGDRHELIRLIKSLPVLLSKNLRIFLKRKMPADGVNRDVRPRHFGDQFASHTTKHSLWLPLIEARVEWIVEIRHVVAPNNPTLIKDEMAATAHRPPDRGQQADRAVAMPTHPP